MDTTHIFLFLLIQSVLALADINFENSHVELEDILANNSLENDLPQSSKEISDWDDLLDTKIDLYPTPSTILMEQATSSDKSPEEQLEEMKAMADHITVLVQNEMASLLKYAMSCGKKDENSRQKRSIETPMDSTELIMRLLNHIKSNNEYQNIAIEKMMSAQEIADKYGIAFDPDTEVLTELAKTANEQAIEMTSILKDACDLQTSPKCKTDKANKAHKLDNDTRPVTHMYGNDLIEYEFSPLTYQDSNNYNHKPSQYDYYNVHQQETQIPRPPSQNFYPPTSQRPNFYDTVVYPAPDSYCSMDPFSNYQYDPDSLICDPIVVGEEFEETVTSKVMIEPNNEPGSGTVSHVTTYTVSEKTHFKTPEIENLPQQMQYYFFLV